jgi:3-oxoacyl-[acyl-carrier-protein] synthase-3
VALCEAIDEGRVKSGDTIVMSGFGAGLSWGTAVWKWH